MKKWLKGAGAAIAFTWLTLNHPASAQECFYDPCCEPAFNPFYFGVNAGFASYQTERADLIAFFGSVDTPIETNTSWAAGIQIGYDWLFCNKFLGVVVDWDWTDASTQVVFFPNSPPIEHTIDSRFRWFTTIRARGGIAFHNILFYLTGGAAVADIKTEITNNLLTPADHLFQKHRWGWTAGFGSEFIFCNNWSVNAELLYLRFRSETVSLSAGGIDYSFKFFDDAWVGRIGLNYRFSLCSL